MSKHTPKPLPIIKNKPLEQNLSVWKRVHPMAAHFVKRLLASKYEVGDCVRVNFYPKPVREQLEKHGIKVAWVVTEHINKYYMWRIK